MAVLVFVVLTTAAGAVYAAAWHSASRRPRGQRATKADIAAMFRRRQQERRQRAEAALPPLPAEDVPPPGLAPLVPSPRTMRLEAMRGIRELEDWLAGRASSA